MCVLLIIFTVQECLVHVVLNCIAGLNHTASSGEITSPGWPGNYPTNQDCFDIISAPGKTITVTFLTFHMETCGPGLCDTVTGSYKNTKL